MSVWQARIDGSDALAAAREAKTVIEAGEARSPEEQDHLDRQHRVVELVEWTLTSSDPLLVPSDVLANLATHLRSGIEHLTNWRAGSGGEHLTTHAANAFDRALLDLGAIPLPASSAEAATEIASLRRSVGQHRAQVDREIEGLEAAARDVRQASTASAEDGAAKVAQFTAEIEVLREQLAQLSTTSRDLANQQQNAFAAAQTERQEVFARLLDEKRDETAAAVDALRKQIDDEVTATKTASESDLAAVEAAKVRVEEILGIVSEEALVGTYSKNAADDRKAADLWRWIAVGAIAITVCIGIWLVAAAHAKGTDWDLFASKLALAAPIGGIAAYAARQSSEHRHAQREAAHVALQLTALKPYLNDLAKEDERDKLLVEIAGRLFGHPRRDNTASDAIGDILTDNPTLLAQLASLVQHASKGK